MDDGGSCGRVNSEQPRQPVDQLVLGRFVVEGEDDGGPRGDVARTTHLQGGVEGERRHVKVFNLRSCKVITGYGGTSQVQRAYHESIALCHLLLSLPLCEEENWRCAHIYIQCVHVVLQQIQGHTCI